MHKGVWTRSTSLTDSLLADALPHHFFVTDIILETLFNVQDLVEGEKGDSFDLGIAQAVIAAKAMVSLLAKYKCLHKIL